MDRISQLPESIVHYILSSFDAPPAAELVRMSLLSKTWSHLTASFPHFNFDIDDFTSRESFFKYVEYTSSRFYHQHLTAHSVRLVTNIREPAELDVVNRCLELVLNKGVNVLEIDISNSTSSYDKFRLPNALLSVSVLESLTKYGYELPSSLMLDTLKFKSLIQLSLVNFHVEDEVIRHLTTSCPLLQVFCIIRCYGFKSFCVYGHQNLQDVSIRCNTQVERIDIEAPNLSTLFIADYDASGPKQMNLASCKKLTLVTYHGYSSDGFTDDLLSNFPFIENLVLYTNYECNNLKLSSHSLRTLVLHSTDSSCDLEDIEFKTPNLVSFIYSCGMFKPLVGYLPHFKSCMQCYPDGCLDALWFQKLRQFLDKKNGFKVLNLYMHATCSRKFIESEKKLKAIELPPYELEHVELKLESNEGSLGHIAFVDAVLWCCRPRSLTLRPSSAFIDFKDVAKFTCEKLLQQEDQGHTKIQIVLPSSSEAQKHFMDLKSLSMTSPCEGDAISFIKEEVIQEEAG